jgi:3-oxoacyl-[acyl-carrier protein] reductase
VFRRTRLRDNRHSRPVPIQNVTDVSNFYEDRSGPEFALGMQALKRIGKPEDIADVVAFVASDKVRWITGANIQVGGGSKL